MDGQVQHLGYLKSENKTYPNTHQSFSLHNQRRDTETGLHYNLFRYYYAPQIYIINVMRPIYGK